MTTPMSKLTNEERVQYVRKFREIFPNFGEISRDDFDLAIIDMGLAEDPGTDDTTSAAHKGFVQMRSNARRALTTWAAKMLPPNEAFTLTIAKQNPLKLEISPVDDGIWAEAADIGNRVEKFTRNKVKRVTQLEKIIGEHALESPELDEVVKMIGMMAGYSVVMKRNILAEVKKFNDAVALVEAKATAAVEAAEKLALPEEVEETEEVE